MGANVDKQTTISRGASSKFVSRRKSILRRLLAILRFADDRPMLQIGPSLRSCGGESWSRTHAAANREFDDDACCRAALWLHYGAGGRPFFPGYLRIMARRMAALWLPSWGLEGGLFSPISADYDETYGRPLAPYRGWRAACPGYATIMPTTMAALWLHYGAGGRPFVPVSADYGDDAMTCGRPLAPIIGGWRAAFCPGICGL